MKSMSAYSVVSRSGGSCSAFFSWLSEKATVVYTRPSGFVVRESSGVVNLALKQEHMFKILQSSLSVLTFNRVIIHIIPEMTI